MEKYKYIKYIIVTLVMMIFSTNAISQITSYPHTTTFASGFGDWNQSGTDNFDWTHKTNGTTSSGTGPQSYPYGANGTTGYVYTETSSPISTNQTARIFCTYDLSSASAASISFYYHLYAQSGYGPGTLRLKIYKGNAASGGSWHYPWTVTTSYNGWQSTTIDLADYVGYSYVQLAFESITPSTGTVWQCDNAIDEVEVTATLCSNTWAGTAGDGDWNNASNWSCGSVPASGSDINIPSGLSSYPTINSNTTFGDLTVINGGTMTVSSGTLTINGATDIDGTLSISGIVDANGTFDATNGTIDIPSGTLKLSGVVNSLGNLDNNSGTVEYDGGTQNVITEDYHNLSIKTTGTKSATGNLTVNGELSTESTSLCKLDMGAYDLTLKGSLSVGAIDGLDLTDNSCDVTFAGLSTQSITHAGSSKNITESNTTDYSIPDQSYVESSISVTSTANANQVSTITLNITHTYTADLDITLYAPDGSSIDLTSDNGSSGNNYTNTIFSSNAATAITAGYAPFTGSYTPEQAFSNLTGSANGTWKLRVSDDYSGDTGDLLNWEIVINGTASGGIFERVTLNNSSDVNLNSNLEIEGTLTLTNGDLNTSTNTITVTTNGSIAGGSATSMIVGNLVMKTNSTSEKNFPIGDGTNYRPVLLTPSSVSDETWTVKYYNTAHANTTMGTGLHHVSQYYWDISRENSVNAQLVFDWDAGYAVDVPSDLRLAHFNSGTSEWEDMGANISGAGGSGSATASSGRLTATATSFSPFGFGSSGSGNALPIELVSFTGEYDGSNVQIDWSVASQLNNDYYTVEKSTDFTEWEEIATVLGAGNSNQLMDYRIYDERPIIGHNYYRLTQTDYDGASETFHPIVVSIKGERKEVVLMYNQIGQEVNKDFKGLVILLWDNGDITKTINE